MKDPIQKESFIRKVRPEQVEYKLPALDKRNEPMREPEDRPRKTGI